MTDNIKGKQRQQLHDRGICVIIPTFNNAGTIAAVVGDALIECKDVIVVNDGSTDNTAAIAKEFNIKLIDRKENMGIGYSRREALCIKNRLQARIADGICLCYHA